jgi:nitroreductase
VDTSLAIASRREVRDYDGRPLEPGVLERILDAGRLAGSARNRQPWRFVVVESAERRERLAELVHAPDNIRGATAVVAIVGRGFDAGRCGQNMLLAAWNEGVGSCPNGLHDAAAAADLLELGDDDDIATVISLGYPERPRHPERRSPEEWSARADRKSLDELVTRL